MSDLPEPVQRLYTAIEHLPGVRTVELSIQPLEGVDVSMLRLPGEFADLPIAALRRSNGGRVGERLITAEIQFSQDRDGWIAVEFLAWWVRDLSRADHDVQMRPLALPPIGLGKQLGRTLKFVIEFFFIHPEEDNEPILKQIGEFADSLQSELHEYGEALDNPTATDWETIDDLKHLAEVNDAEAMVELGLMLASDEENTPDPTTAYDWYVKAAELGHPEGAFQAGQVLATGIGAPTDLVKAVEYYTEAAEAGHPLAMAMLGQCYQQGEGVEQNEATAADWYRRGGDAGEPACWAQLGDCYENGTGVEKDLNEALELYERANEMGFEEVQEAIDRVKAQLGQV